MKALYIILPLLLLLGCAGQQIMPITETANNQAIAYSAGKLAGMGILKIAPVSDKELQEVFDKMMERNKDVDIIPSTEIVNYFNESVMVLTRYTKDPYGLISDLSVILMIYGAQFDEAGNLFEIMPIPKSVVRFFGMGYDSGRAMILKGVL